MSRDPQREAWSLDQVARSLFFHQKLQVWGLLSIAETIEQLRGEEFDWNLKHLHISSTAWNKVIHRGIKPVIVFAHPDVLRHVLRGVSYYRMLAMVSQKSMLNIGLRVDTFETGAGQPDADKALHIAQRLNTIISNLVEADESLSSRDFDLWRGMAAGTQAQGSWQNAKGDRAEILVKNRLVAHLLETGRLDGPIDANARQLDIQLVDGRHLVFASEPDIALYRGEQILAAVEVKGGIDQAGVLERVGAAIKSLARVTHQHAEAVTILILPTVSMTDQAIQDIEANRDAVGHWFTIEQIIDDEETRQRFFRLLDLISPP